MRKCLLIWLVVSVPFFSFAGDQEAEDNPPYVDYSQFLTLNEFIEYHFYKYSAEPSTDEILKAEAAIRFFHPSLYRIAAVIVSHDYQLPNVEILRQIYKFEKKQNKILTDTRILSAAKGFLHLQGEKLIKKPKCFTCAMRVLTPYGYRPIGDLDIGDTVISWDFDHGQTTKNRVLAVHEGQNVEFGELISRDFPRGFLEVTPDHPLYSVDNGGYTPLEKLGDNSRVLRINLGLAIGQCRGFFTKRPAVSISKRGAFVKKGRAQVRGLALSGKHQNYFVEGVLVRGQRVPM